MGKNLDHQSALVATAAALFQRQGYHGTGLAQLLGESGAPKGSFYYHFPRGKEQLAAAAVTHAGEGIGQMATAAIQEAKAPAEAMRLFATRLATWVERTDFRAGCPVTSVLLDTAPDSELTSAACRRAFEDWIQLWCSCFESWGMADSEARGLAVVWVSALEGAWILARAQRTSVALIKASELIATLAPAAGARVMRRQRQVK